MTVQYASAKNASGKSLPASVPQLSNIPANPWTRPSDWLSIPSITAGDQKVYALVAIFEFDPNPITIQCTGAYTVDWGDGTSNNYASTAVATKAIAWSTISSGTLTTQGFRQALITITPQAGQNITKIDFSVKPTGYGTYLVGQWLDIKISMPNLSTGGLVIGGGQTVPTMLQQVDLMNTGGLPSLANQFLNCYNLKSVVQNGSSSITVTTAPTHVGSMFQNCYALEYPPTITNTTSITNTGSMYANCYNLKYAPSMNLPACTTMQSMFSGCYSLVEAPVLTTSTSLTTTGVSSMFQNCYSLKVVPSFITTNCTDVTSMFSGCIALERAPYLDLQNCTTILSMFAGCTSLTTVPQYNLTKVTSATTAFQNCSTLKVVPKLQLPNCTQLQSTFANCYNLEEIDGLVTTTTLTNINSMFLNCSTVKSIPTFITSNVTTGTSAFSGCTSLNSVPELDTGKITSFANFFDTCRNISVGPNINTASGTSFANMFSNCSALTTVPVYNSSKVTDMSFMFRASGIETIPTGYDFSNVISVPSMFENCSELTYLPALNLPNATNLVGMFVSASNLKRIESITAPKMTSTQNMFYLNSSLRAAPTLSCANVTTTTNMFYNTGGLSCSYVNLVGMKVAFSVGTLNLSKVNLESMFANLGTPATAQAVTITSNPGADTAVVRTGNSTAGSSTIIMANTVGITTGMIATGAYITTGIPTTFTDAGDLVTYTNTSNVSISNNDTVMFTAITSTTGITANTTYYVVNYTGSSFQVSSTQGGAALPLTTNGTGLMNVGWSNSSVTGSTVTAVNANANVVLSGAATFTTTNISLTFRNLNITPATARNWTITG